MDIINWFAFIFIIGFIALMGILRSSKVSTTNEYLLAGRNTRLFSLIATLVMTEFNTATLLSFSTVGFYASWWALSLPFIFLIGLLFYAITVAKKWNNFQGFSVAQFFSARYGKDIGILACIILFLAMACFSAAYIKSLTLLFLPLFVGINTWILSAILVGIVLLMTWRGGLIAIIRTDVISFLFVLIFFPLLLFYAWKLPVENLSFSLMDFQEMQKALPLKFVASLILLTMFSYILAPWYSQKVISAQSPKTAKLAVIIAAVIVFFLYAFGILATCQLRRKGIAFSDTQEALPYLIKNALPMGLKGSGYAILYLVGATTLSGVWSAMVTLITHNKSQLSERNHLKRSMILTGICAFLTYLLANLFVDHVFNKMILANIPVVALSFGLLGGFYWKNTTRLGIYISILCGLLWGTGCYWYYGEENFYTWYWAVYGIPLIFLSGMFFSNKKFNKEYIISKVC